MDGGRQAGLLCLGPAELAGLMPMHLWIDRAGIIRAAGPTLAKLSPSQLAGANFFDCFELRKPRGVGGPQALAALANQRILLSLRAAPATTLRGVAVRSADGQGLFFNLSFGLSVAEAVRDHRLTHADFAPTDLTVELLYLTEVKGVVMGELAALNARLRDAHLAAEAQAMTDPLTGLANRRAFEAALAQTRLRAERGGCFALLHLDLDHFKAVNDTHGHAAGDAVLTGVAAILRRELRGQDVIARVGGDEFVALAEGIGDERKIATIAARIIAGLEALVPVPGQAARVSASIGAVLAGPGAVAGPDDLMRAADGALYAAKHAGRGRSVIVRLEGAGQRRTA